MMPTKFNKGGNRPSEMSVMELLKKDMEERYDLIGRAIMVTGYVHLPTIKLGYFWLGEHKTKFTPHDNPHTNGGLKKDSIMCKIRHEVAGKIPDSEKLLGEGVKVRAACRITGFIGRDPILTIENCEAAE